MKPNGRLFGVVAVNGNLYQYFAHPDGESCNIQFTSQDGSTFTLPTCSLEHGEAHYSRLVDIGEPLK